MKVSQFLLLQAFHVDIDIIIDPWCFTYYNIEKEYLYMILLGIMLPRWWWENS